MKVNLGLGAHNSQDWERFHAKSWDEAPAIPDSEIVQGIMRIGDMAEPLGFNGIWAPEHCGTPYGMTPNPIQMLTYFAGRTEELTFGTMVIVAPWWHPVRLAHQIAYLDILSGGRFETIGIGRGVAKSEFDAVGVPREESRQRMDETLDILELAFTQERFAYDGEIFKIPEMSLRPKFVSDDLATRFHGASSTGPSLEANARRGLTPLFVGNKPIEQAGEEVKLVNTFRKEEGLAPCQPKNVLFMYCTSVPDGGEMAQEVLNAANRDVTLHYGFGNPDSFAGVKGYESYAKREGYATAPDAQKLSAQKDTKKSPGYDKSNLLIGTPDQIIERIEAAQKACSFSEITILPNIGTMSLDQAADSVKLFAREVLPVVQKMDAPIHASVLPDGDGDTRTASAG
ncbi:LLM class flavin-dependent oxidoreductase [Croceicoccus sp. Ery5]|uniref:LLM class flavin-dependent oxidoreductase n=1 Tax=Croceicoccus sp. Ery5 TaxID=1703340 RepID=UPI001E324356|nr:LLM class flavin-dependent oxidoreductase [Croceicoccus sp. Ery5]